METIYLTRAEVAEILRRSGRDLYCAQRCGYYLTPGQRRQAA